MSQLTLVLPTYEERESLPVLIGRIEEVLAGYDFEVIVVDDNSPDETWRLAGALARSRPWLRILRRLDRRGLSSAIMDGFGSASSPYLVVMDADLQHDETILPQFFHAFQEGADLVVGTRMVQGMEQWSRHRRLLSWLGTLVARVFLPHALSDPLSGFFGLRRELYEKLANRINPRGFKLLLEILAWAGQIRVRELGYTFRPRRFGYSKLTESVILGFAVALYDIRFGRVLPWRFMKFGLVGLTGMVVSQSGLWLGRSPLGWADSKALILGIEASILSNFALNNYWTFADVRLRGLGGIGRGLLYFNSICLVGLLINYSLALYLSGRGGLNIYAANLIGIVLAASWNYLINVQVTWQQGR